MEPFVLISFSDWQRKGRTPASQSDEAKLCVSVTCDEGLPRASGPTRNVRRNQRIGRRSPQSRARFPLSIARADSTDSNGSSREASRQGVSARPSRSLLARGKSLRDPGCRHRTAGPPPSPAPREETPHVALERDEPRLPDVE